MSYANTELRSRLAPAGAGGAQPCAAPQYVDFGTVDPETSATGSCSWWVRGQNFVLCYTVARPGEVLARQDQADEYMVLFPTDRSAAHVSAGRVRVEIGDAAVVVVPPGSSSVEVSGETTLVRLFSATSTDLLAKCHNNLDYREPHANVAPFQPWPDPLDGHRLRSYRSVDYPYTKGRFGRIFRCSTVMVNVFDVEPEPRDPTRLSPHSHADFEQCSLAVRGEYVHHIRTPWTPDSLTWRVDDHVRVPAPSVAIIPPPATHTSQSVGSAGNQLVDIFCPPRADFSAQPGWVINESEYPVPPEAGR
jgi:hypothetical protein